VPVTDAASTISWAANEAAAATPSNPTLRQVLLKPKIAIGVVQFSRQLMLQANAEAFVRAELLAAAGSVVDAAVLAGTGASGQPTGLLSASGLSTQSGTSLSWAGLLAMKATSAARGARDDALGVIATPAVRQLLEGRERAAGSGFIWGDGRCAGMPAFAATQMSAGTLLVGPWPRVVLGLFGAGLELTINPFDPSGFKAGIVQARVLLSLDVGIAADPAAFVKSTSIT
jgi:hypothetical protein